MRCEQEAVSTAANRTLPPVVAKRQGTPLEWVRNDPGHPGMEYKRARHGSACSGSAPVQGACGVQIRSAIEHWHACSDRLQGDGPPLSWSELQAFCRGACAVPAVKDQVPAQALDLMQAVVCPARALSPPDALTASQQAGIVQALLTAWTNSYLAERVDMD